VFPKWVFCARLMRGGPLGRRICAGRVGFAPDGQICVWSFAFSLVGARLTQGQAGGADVHLAMPGVYGRVPSARQRCQQRQVRATRGAERQVRIFQRPLQGNSRA
jgi:hypothetical protein